MNPKSHNESEEASRPAPRVSPVIQGGWVSVEAYNEIVAKVRSLEAAPRVNHGGGPYEKGSSDLHGCHGILTSDGYRIADVQHGYADEVLHALNIEAYRRGAVITHWDGCWKEHLGCAVARIASLEAALAAREPVIEAAKEMHAAAKDYDRALYRAHRPNRQEMDAVEALYESAKDALCRAVDALPGGPS